jgi:hypothetical protein
MKFETIKNHISKKLLKNERVIEQSFRKELANQARFIPYSNRRKNDTLFFENPVTFHPKTTT